MALNAILTPFPADFEVWEVRFSDGMNRPFELVVRGASTHANVDLRPLLGHRMTLSLPDEALLSSVHGIVKQASRGTPEPSGVTVYELHIAPAEWVLTKRTNSRIFQKQTATAILGAILREHPVTTEPAVFTRTLAEREYCVQYDETDSDFAHRLLAEEGMAAYFDQSAGGRWTLVDDTTIQKPPEDPDLVVHANSSNLKPGALAVLRWRVEQRIQPVAAALRDYDFERPLLSLEHATAPFEAASVAEAALEVYHFEPDRLLRRNDDGGETRRDIEGARATVELVELETNFAAPAGTSLHIEGEDISGEWLVVGAEVVMRSSSSGNAATDNHRRMVLTAIPLSTPYRPEHRKRPLLFGTQSARVVGATPEGTVDVDDHGRVNLELRWDRRDLWARGAAGKESPTRRVRVAQAWAGPGYGFVTLPRVGDEVLVAYEDGNPDRPLVIGRLHNAVSRTPLQLPNEQKTLSSWKSQSFGASGPVEGYNFVMMDDAAGAEVLGFRAQRNMSTQVLHDATTEIAGSETVRVTGGQSVGVGGGQSTQVGGISDLKAQHVFVTASGAYLLVAGYVNLVSSGDFHIEARGERVDKSEVKHHFQSPTMFFHAANAVQMLTGKCHIQTESELVLQCKGSIIRLTPGGININSPGPVEINGSPIKLNC